MSLRTLTVFFPFVYVLHLLSFLVYIAFPLMFSLIICWVLHFTVITSLKKPLSLGVIRTLICRLSPGGAGCLLKVGLAHPQVVATFMITKGFSPVLAR